MTEHCIVLTTVGSAAEAKRLASELVGRELAACVNIMPTIESVYRWKGTVESASEWLLIVKTRAAAFERVRDAIRELHSYELPECIQVPITNGSVEYLAWIGENVK